MSSTGRPSPSRLHRDLRISSHRPGSASSMASSSVSPASSSFGRLLKSSKVVSQFDPSIQLVYTTHGGSKARSDYGLKRALPKITTPAIRVHSLDNPLSKLTDFSYAAREKGFVDGFRESHVKIGGPTEGQSAVDHRARLRMVGQTPEGCSWDKKNFLTIQDLKKKAKEGKSVKLSAETLQIRSKQGLEALFNSSASSAGKPSGSTEATVTSTPEYQEQLQFPPDYLHMSDAQFHKFLHKLAELRPKFIEYLRSKLPTQDPNRQFYVDMLYQAQHPERLGAIITEFLAVELPAFSPDKKGPLQHDPRQDTLQPSEHYAFGLTYAAPNLYMSDQATRPLPLRLLDNVARGRDAAFSVGDSNAAPGIVLSTITPIKSDQRPSEATKYDTDTDGAYQIDYGRGLARIEHAYIRHPGSTDRGKKESPDEILYGVETDQVDNPFKKPTVLDEQVVQLKSYKAGSGQGKLKPKRIGSREWVSSVVSGSTNEENVRSGRVHQIFGVEDKIRAPSYLGTESSQVPRRSWSRSRTEDASAKSVIGKLHITFLPAPFLIGT